MLTESIAILAIIACMIVVFIRSGNGDYAASIVPLLLVPFVHLVATPICHGLDSLFVSVPFELMLSFADIGAVAVSALLIWAFSSRIKSRRAKKLYVGLVSGYNVILACAYVSRTLSPLLAHLQLFEK